MLGEKTGEYLNEDGRLSSTKKLTDSRYYQDYSYSLRSSKQVSEYEETVNDLLHPVAQNCLVSLDQHLLLYKWVLTIFLATESNDILILEDGDNILMEQYFEPSHSINLDKLQLYLLVEQVVQFRLQVIQMS